MIFLAHLKLYMFPEMKPRFGQDYWEGKYYYHFWINDSPVRNYYFLTDNSQIALQALH